MSRESQRVLNGSITKGSTSRYIGVASGSDSLYSELRQGANLQNPLQMSTNLLRHVIRGGEGLITTLKGRDLSPNVFDDSLATTTVLNASLTESANFSMAGLGRIDRRFSHIEEKAFGQSDVYDDKFPFFDIMSVDPKEIVTVHPSEREPPPALVDSESISSLNGTIDVFEIRNRKSNSSTEEPFLARGTKASFGHSQDSYRRCLEIKPGFSLEPTKPAFFLDCDLSMRLVKNPKSSFFGLYQPGPASDFFQKSKPFDDTSHDSENFYKDYNLDPDVKNILVQNKNISFENYRSHDKMATSGIQYENSDIGVDSVAYGGLLK